MADDSSAIAKNSSDITSEIYAELESKPRKSSNWLLDLHAAEAQTNAFDNQLTAFLKAYKNDAVQRCRYLVMRRSDRPTEYFEVSFVPRASSRFEQGIGHSVTLEGVIFERSTLTLSSEEESCFTNVFAQLEIDSRSVPDYRMSYQICFGNLKEG